MDNTLKIEFPLGLYLLLAVGVIPFLGFIVFALSDQNIYVAIGFSILIVLSCCCFVFPATTQLSDKGIKQLSIRGWIEANWIEIKKVESHAYGYHLYSDVGKFIVAPMIYSNGTRLML